MIAVKYAYALPIEPASQPAEPKAKTFEAHGKTWTRHEPGDPRPCDGEAVVEWLLESEFFGEQEFQNGYAQPAKKLGNWSSVVGWRYAEQPSHATSPDPKGEAGKAKAPLARQEGGSHYKDFAIQPVEFITANRLTFLEGCVIKRVCRHRRKNGAEDIRKAIHELELILALEYPDSTARHPACPD